MEHLKNIALVIVSAQLLTVVAVVLYAFIVGMIDRKEKTGSLERELQKS